MSAVINDLIVYIRDLENGRENEFINYIVKCWKIIDIGFCGVSFICIFLIKTKYVTLTFTYKPYCSFMLYCTDFAEYSKLYCTVRNSEWMWFYMYFKPYYLYNVLSFPLAHREICMIKLLAKFALLNYLIMLNILTICELISNSKFL